MPQEDPPPDSQQPTGTSRDTTRAGNDSPPDVPAKIQRLGDFEILRELGRGGMGVVYEARQISLNRRVALKVLPPTLGSSSQASMRFEREAHAAAKLHHTNIVPVYATGKDHGCHYYAMELIGGQPLSEVLSDLSGSGSNPLMEETVTKLGGGEPTDSKAYGGRLTSGITSLSDASTGDRKWFDAVAKLIADVADALEYAHGRGVIHRDIKPANLMLSHDGKLSITDFGLARVAQEPRMTVSGSLMGTPAYMSPEQIASGRMKLDHRTDIYSLGAVLYETLTLRRPFPGANREEILGNILTKNPPRPRRFNPRIPLDLETICLKAMEKDPDRRYATAGRFANDLRQYLQRGLITARRASLARRAWTKLRQHPVATVTVLAAVLVASIGGMSWYRVRHADFPRLVSEARLLLVQGEYREGLEKIAEALAIDPRDRDARLIRARMLIARMHYPEAAREVRALLREDHENWEAHMVMAVLGKKGELATIPAEEHLAAVEGKAPETAEALYMRGLLADSHHEAIRRLDRALELNPGHALALLERGGRHGLLKDLPASLADAERLIAVRPFSAQGRRLKAAAHRAMHDEERALDLLSSAIELDPEDPITYRQRAWLLQDRGRGDDALADHTRAVELDPEVSDFLSRRAWQYYAKKEYDAAIADALRAIEINPDDRRAYRYLMYAYWHGGRRDEARAALERLQQRAAGWVDKTALAYVHDSARWYHRNTGDLDQALAEAERVIELRPGELHGYRLRAEIQRLLGGESAVADTCDQMAGLEFDEPQRFFDRANLMASLCGRPDEALAGYSRAIELAPSWADPYQKRGWLHKRKKRFDEALADLDHAIELAPTWLQAVYNRGMVYADLERFEQALADYERCAELGAEGPYFRRNQAIALMRLGREQAAVDLMDAFLETNPMDSETLLNRALLLFKTGRLDEALATANRAVEAQPSRAWPYTIRSWIGHFKQGSCVQVAQDFDAMTRLATDSAAMWNARAGLLVTYGERTCAELYDPQRALALARKAVAYDSGSAEYQSTLGIALYRNGEFGEAREALSRARELRVNEEPADLFFLAMASFKLDEDALAHAHYDRAVARMNATFANDPESMLFRQEAADVLGIR